MCLLIGLPVAYFAAFKVSEKWKTIILALVVIPSFTSFLIRTVAWRIPLAPNGEFSRWLTDIGLVGDRGIQLLETQTAVQIAIVYNYLGFMILPLFVALDRIDVRMREASKDLGAGRLATFFGVTLPLAKPGIVAGVLLTFIPMCGDYVTATVLGGAKGNMIGSMIASQFSGAQNWPLGSAMAILMIGAVLLSMVVGAGIVASHGPKRLLNDVTILGTRLGQRPSSKTSKHNMPSGHSTLVSAGGWFMARRYSMWFLLLCLPVTALTMYARVMLGAHTVSATIAGSIIGILVAALFVKRRQRTNNNRL